LLRGAGSLGSETILGSGLGGTGFLTGAHPAPKVMKNAADNEIANKRFTGTRLLFLWYIVSIGKGGGKDVWKM
jgi:hypothetical protein